MIYCQAFWIKSQDNVISLCACSMAYFIVPSSSLNLGRIILIQVKSSKINTVSAATIIRLLTGVGPAGMKQLKMCTTHEYVVRDYCSQLYQQFIICKEAYIYYEVLALCMYDQMVAN